MAGTQKFWKDGLAWGPLDGDGTSKFWKDGLAYKGLAEDAGPLSITGGAGIPSEEAFGSPGYASSVFVTGATGIPSEETFGSPGYMAPWLTGDTGIPSGEAFGALGAIGDLLGTLGIPTGEAFGSGGSLSPGIFGSTGIPSAETFGDPSSPHAGVALVLESGVSGIPSAEAFGTGGTLVYGVGGVLGIPSAEAFGAEGLVLNQEVSISRFALYIGTTDYTEYMLESGVSIDEQLNFQYSASIKLYDTDATATIGIGQNVIIMHLPQGFSTWQRIFAGTVETVNKNRHIPPGEVGSWYTLTATSRAKSLSRRLVNRTYKASEYGNLYSIMLDIDRNYLRPEGLAWIPDLSLTSVAIPTTDFIFKPLNDAIAQLCTTAELQWGVDYFGNVYISETPAPVTAAPYNITEDTSGPNGEVWYDLNITESRGTYRNKIFIRGAINVKTSLVTKTYITPTNLPVPGNPYLVYWDGQILNDTEYQGRVNRIIDIKVDGVSVPFFTQRLVDDTFEPAPSGWKFMQIWERDIQLIWDLLGDPTGYPTTGQELEVTFEMLDEAPTTLSVQNTAQIQARQAIEGGTGLYEDYLDLPEVKDEELLVSLAEGWLAKASQMGLEVETGSDKFGYAPGQEIEVYLPSRGITSPVTVRIEAVTKTVWQLFLLRYRLRLSNNTLQRDAQTAFDRLIKKLRNPNPGNLTNIQFELAKTLPGVTNPGLVVGTGLGNTYVVTQPMTLKELRMYFKTPPTGADIIMDILRNGTSIFAADSKPTYPAAETGVLRVSTFITNPVRLEVDDLITLNVTQVGSANPGKDGTLTLSTYT